MSRLREIYRFDKVSLAALQDVEESDYKLMELKALHQNDIVRNLVKGCLERYKNSYVRLATDRKLSESERESLFISMDWASFVLDSVGVDPKEAERQLDETVEEYARKANLSTA